jgi:hypothetical protein
MEVSRSHESNAPSLACNTHSVRPHMLGLLAAMLAIDLVEVYFCVRGINSSVIDFDENLPQCLIVGQTILLSIWTGLGGTSVTLRCFATLAFIEGWCFLLPVRFIEIWPDGYTLRCYPQQMFNALMPVFLLLVVLLWLGRLFGLRLVKVEENGERRPASARFQFSIRCLLEWTAIVAAFLGSLSYIFRRGTYPAMGHYWFWQYCAEYAASYSTLALLLAWAVLGVRARLVRLVIQVVFAFMAVRLLVQHELFAHEMKTFLLAAILLASLWCIRVIGYRMVWCKCRPVFQ